MLSAMVASTGGGRDMHDAERRSGQRDAVRDA